MAFNKSFLGSSIGGACFGIGLSLTGVSFGGEELIIFDKSPLTNGALRIGPFVIRGIGGGGGGGGA